MDDRTQSSRARRAAADPHHRLKAVVSRCFPPHARILSIPRQADAVFAISWRLRTDPHRPAKRSKTIRLALSADLLDHYFLASEPDRRAADRRIGSALRLELASFDADHTEPPGEDPPLVSWILGCE